MVGIAAVSLHGPLFRYTPHPKRNHRVWASNALLGQYRSCRLRPADQGLLCPREGEQRYSPAEVKEVVPAKIIGHPMRDRVCTSHVERQNLSIRMGMRRMTRLTNAFSKEWENLEAAYALWFACYNWRRKHQTLGMTPAMRQGLTDHQWTVGELVRI